MRKQYEKPTLEVVKYEINVEANGSAHGESEQDISLWW